VVGRGLGSFEDGMDIELVLLLILGCSPNPRRFARRQGVVLALRAAHIGLVPQYSLPIVEVPRKTFEDADNVPAAVSSWRGSAVGRLQDFGWCR
jgi:hypothetical protein